MCQIELKLCKEFMFARMGIFNTSLVLSNFIQQNNATFKSDQTNAFIQVD